MSKYIGPKIRLMRRLGAQLFGRKDEKAKKYNYAKKNYAPGQHGQLKVRKLSEYGKQLAEKQKVRFMFNLTEKQMRNYYKKATKSSNVSDEEFMKLIETRLDNIIYRAGFAKTRAQARQIVNHSLMSVNGKKMNIPSMNMEVGDKFEVKERAKNMPLFQETTKLKDSAPRWLSLDFKKLSGEVIAMPKKDDFEKIIDTKLVIEYYSK